MLSAVAAPSTDRGGCPHDGDVTQDASTTPADALLAFQHFLAIATPALTLCQQDRADVTQDGRITPADALCIFQRSLSLPSCLDPQSPPARLEMVAGNDVGVVVDTPQQLVVRVTGAAGEPVRGIPVRFRIIEPATGTGTLSAAEVATGANGQAATTLRVDQRAGLNRVEASVGGLASVVFTVTGCFDRNSARLIQVGGNNQSAQAGDELQEPLVARMEDQFGNRGAGETLDIAASERTEVTVLSQAGQQCQTSAAALTAVRRIVPPAANGNVAAVTDAQGEVQFRLRVRADAGDEDIQVQVSAPALPQVEPVQFLVIVGRVDTPDIPLALAVSGDVVFVADRFSGLPVFDVRTPTQPGQLHPTPLNLDGTEWRLALVGNRAYIGTLFPVRLYILDISNPRAAEFPADQDNNRLPDVVLGQIDLPAEVQLHEITGIAVQGAFAYVVTHRRASAEGEGTLQILDISDPKNPRIVGALALERSRPQGIAVSGDVAYISASEGGLRIVDVRNPTQPVAVRTVGEAEGSGFFSGIVIRDGFAYAVESRSSALVVTHHFTVFDLSSPTDPQRRGRAAIRTAGPLAIAGRFAYLGQFASGLLIMDIADPNAPKPVGVVDTPSVVLNVTADERFVYAADQIFGLQVIPGVPADAPDFDGDGIIDRFDVFPRDPTEFQDTDRDGIGDNADSDDDNDSFSDLEEQDDPFADAKNPQIFPPGRPPEGATHIVIDAASRVPPRQRNGSEEAPYGSVSEGIRALRKHTGVAIQTVVVRPGIYSPLTTQEIFPIDLTGLSGITIQSIAPEAPSPLVITMLDAGFSGDILLLRGNTQLTIDGLILAHGAHGILANAVTGVTIQRNIIVANIFDGVAMGINAREGNLITTNIIDGNGQNGVHLFEESQATLTNNAIGTDTLGGNGWAGIFVAGQSTADITANTVMQNGTGISIELASSATLTNNIVRSNERLGVLVQQNSQVTATGNILSENGGETLFVIPPDVAAVTDFTILGTGIAVNDRSTAVITGNTIDANLVGGVVVERNSTATIADNTMQTNGLELGIAPNGFGLVLFENTASTTVRNNVISGNGGTGLVVANGSLAEITRNTLQRNGLGSVPGGVGIFVVNGADATITANDIGENLEGILFQSTASGTVEDNAIHHNSFDGMRLESNSSASLDNNSIFLNGNDGVQVDSGAFATVRNGAITQNGGHGMFVSRVSRADIGPRGNVVTVAENVGAGIMVNVDGSVAGIGTVQDDLVCILFSDFFPFPCLQFAFEHVFLNQGGDFVPPLDAGPYVSIP